MDILNKFDPIPRAFGPAIKPAAKPTAAELREKELREFETKTDGDGFTATVMLANVSDWMSRVQWIGHDLSAPPLIEQDFEMSRMLQQMRDEIYRLTALSTRVHIGIKPFPANPWLYA